MPQVDVMIVERSTRQGGTKIVERKPPRVIVDAREFRSALPFLIHQKGIEVIPTTIEVGDYVLSPDMCVERKSIPDLLGSLASGRLFAQLEVLTKCYRVPILLIEFDENKYFTLQGNNELGQDISHQNLSSKLVLLILQFPNLRLIWSPSAYYTAALFLELKRGEEEPNEEAAAKAGVDSEELAEFNLAAQDMLRSLPGITHKNYKQVMVAVKNMKELLNKSLEELQQLIGPKNGKELYDFIRK